MKPCVGAASLLMVAVMVSVSAGAALAETDGGWSEPVNVSDSVWRISSYGDTVVAHGVDTCVVSVDGGDTWGEELLVEGMLEAGDGVIYRANITGYPDYGDTVYFSKSTDDGQTWSSPVGVLTLEEWNDWAYGVYMLGSTLVMYSYDSAGTDEGRIVASRSTDEGATWSAQSVVDPYVHVEDPIPADMVLWDGKMYLAYWNYSYESPEFDHVVLTESADMGLTWTNRQVVAEGVLPNLAANGDSLFITYFGLDGTDGLGVYFTESADGATWSEPVLVGPVEDVDDFVLIHSLATVGDDIFVGYTDLVSSGDDYSFVAHANHSADGGATWTDMGDVAGAGAEAGFIWMDASNGRVHALMSIFEDSSDEVDVYYTQISLATDGGVDILWVALAVACVAAVAVAAAVLLIRRRKA